MIQRRLEWPLRNNWGIKFVMRGQKGEEKGGRKGIPSAEQSVLNLNIVSCLCGEFFAFFASWKK